MPRHITSRTENAMQNMHFSFKFPIYSQRDGIVKSYSLLFLLCYSLKMKVSIRGQMLYLA